MAGLSASEKKKRRKQKLRVVEIAAQEGNTAKPYHATIGMRRRRFGDDIQFAATKECGYGLGRLLRSLVKERTLNRHDEGILLDAAQRFQLAVTAYDKDVLGSPSPNPRAIDMTSIGGLSTREIDQDTIRGITSRYMLIRGAVDSDPKKQEIWRVLRKACIEDDDLENWPTQMINRLVKGLRIVADLA